MTPSPARRVISLRGAAALSIRRATRSTFPTILRLIRGLVEWVVLDWSLNRREYQALTALELHQLP